jgi:putative SOS response-associated peptidase YedK
VPASCSGNSAVIATGANGLVADIHDRMPVIMAPENYERWLGYKPDPTDLMRRQD